MIATQEDSINKSERDKEYVDGFMLKLGEKKELISSFRCTLMENTRDKKKREVTLFDISESTKLHYQKD